MSWEDRERVRKNIAKKNAELLDIANDAKEKGVHPSIVRMVEMCYRASEDSSISVELYKGATEKAITEFEKTQGIVIPSDYRKFLKFSNGARVHVAVVEICGVNKNEHYSLYKYNEEEYRRQNDMGERLPDNFLVIGVNGEGCPICVDLNNGEIILWDREMDSLRCIGDNFFDYLEEDVVGFLEWEMRDNGKNPSD